MTSTKSRGRFVSLDPHPLAVDDEATLASVLQPSDGPLVVDLFCGAGGLSLGLERAGGTVVVGIDHDEHAIATHRAHHKGLSESWDLADPAQVETVGRIVRELEVSLVCGGPPCQPFSRAGRGIIRSLVDRGVRGEADERRDLWQAFLEVVRIGRPSAVLMENVPDMAFDRGMVIIRSVMSELESWGYSVEAKILDASHHGVPQVRRRLFVIALRDGIKPRWPDASDRRTSLIDAIGDLPAFDGGWDHAGLDDQGGMDYRANGSDYQTLMREGCGPRIFDHVTRAVREDDRRAFASMQPGTKYSELDDELKRYRDDIFQDKYNRLDPYAPSRTVTAHLSRDGYAYIHPLEDRTISVREAARIQSFPDQIRFHGPPTSAFKQIGNAVPVLLGEALGSAIFGALAEPTETESSVGHTTNLLADYFNDAETSDALTLKWLGASTTWQLAVGLMLESELNRKGGRQLWEFLKRYPSAEELVLARETGLRLGRQLSMEDQMAEVLTAAERVTAGEPISAVLDARRWDMLCTLSPDEEEALLPSPSMVRVAARYFGESLERLSVGTTGRLLVARLIGATTSDVESAHAARGLLEVSSACCTSQRTLCGTCPLASHCASRESGPETLDLRP